MTQINLEFNNYYEDTEEKREIVLKPDQSLFSIMSDIHPFVKWEKVTVRRDFPHSIRVTLYHCSGGAEAWDDPEDRCAGTKDIIERFQDSLQKNIVSEVCTVTVWVVG
jgi:hypothetical protein